MDAHEFLFAVYKAALDLLGLDRPDLPVVEQGELPCRAGVEVVEEAVHEIKPALILYAVGVLDDEHARALILSDGLAHKVDALYLILIDGIHIGKDLILLLQLIDVMVDIDGEQRKAAHDQQAGNNDDDAGEGHEAVRRDAAEALAYQITKSIQSHSCNTHPFRH